LGIKQIREITDSRTRLMAEFIRNGTSREFSNVVPNRGTKSAKKGISGIYFNILGSSQCQVRQVLNDRPMTLKPCSDGVPRKI
jgi:hypothetical protein